MPLCEPKLNESMIGMVSKCAILVDRAATHGLPEDSFSSIARFWNVYLYARYGAGYRLERDDVATMMALLKVARAAGNPEHVDNYVDGAGYLLLAGEQYV